MLLLHRALVNRVRRCLSHPSSAERSRPARVVGRSADSAKRPDFDRFRRRRRGVGHGGQPKHRLGAPLSAASGQVLPAAARPDALWRVVAHPRVGTDRPAGDGADGTVRDGGGGAGGVGPKSFGKTAPRLSPTNIRALLQTRGVRNRPSSDRSWHSVRKLAVQPSGRRLSSGHPFRTNSAMPCTSGSVATAQRRGFTRLLDRLEAGDVLVVSKLCVGRFA